MPLTLPHSISFGVRGQADDKCPSQIIILSPSAWRRDADRNGKDSLQGMHLRLRGLHDLVGDREQRSAGPFLWEIAPQIWLSATVVGIIACASDAWKVEPRSATLLG